MQPAQQRRRKIFINKPLQLRYMAYFILPILIVCSASIFALYIGVWSSVLDAFTDEQLRSEMLIASRVTEYEQARAPYQEEVLPNSLSLFKQTERLSERQRQIFKDILDRTNRDLIPKLLVLLGLIAWGTVFLSHKVAGPLYRFHLILSEVEKGNLRHRVKLRKFDEAQELAGTLNLCLEKFDFTFARLKNIIRENETNSERMVTRLKEELAKIQTSADR